MLTGFIAGLAILIMVSQLRNIFRADDVTDIGLRAFLQSASENPAGNCHFECADPDHDWIAGVFRNRVGRWPLMLLILIAGLVLGAYH